MSTLWIEAASWGDDYDGDDHFVPYQHHHDDDFDANLDEEHHAHALHPSFEAAGIRHSPCGFSRCPEQDFEHSDAFDRAEEISMRQGSRLPVKSLDLTGPVHGFETTADLHTLRQYRDNPGARRGLPVVFQHRGKQHIMNGHHGIAAAMLRGDQSTPVHHINLDE